MTKCRDEQQGDCGKKSSREGADTKHTRPVGRKRDANRKQQESSTNTEKATRDQPGCKTSHYVPLGTKTYSHATTASINMQAIKSKTGNWKPRQIRPFNHVHWHLRR